MFNVQEELISKYYRLNRNITANELRLLDDQGKQLGIFSKADALSKAQALGVDIVEIAPKAKPPVCKLVDFKKFKYQEKKREREIRKKERAVELKQLRFRPFIGDHDFAVRTRKAKEFLKDNNRVKVMVQFYGRQITHKEFGYKIIDQLKTELKEIGGLERKPRFEGKRLVAYFLPKKGTKKCQK